MNFISKHVRISSWQLLIRHIAKSGTHSRSYITDMSILAFTFSNIPLWWSCSSFSVRNISNYLTLSSRYRPYFASLLSRRSFAFNIYHDTDTCVINFSIDAAFSNGHFVFLLRYYWYDSQRSLFFNFRSRHGHYHKIWQLLYLQVPHCRHENVLV